MRTKRLILEIANDILIFPGKILRYRTSLEGRLRPYVPEWLYQYACINL